MPTYDVTIATCLELPEPNPDQQLVLDALRDAGLSPRMAAWDDPSVDWGATPATVVRSTWNYYRDPDRFVGWADRVSGVSRLLNSARIIRWNSHKRYLLELARAGLHVVPTELMPRGTRVELDHVCDVRGWSRVVVKPAVSAGSFETHMMSRDALDMPTFERLVAARDVLVQPYVESVATRGERSIVAIDGELTHSVRKNPRFAGEDEDVDGPHPIDRADQELAEEAFEVVGEPLLYGRVDIARDASDRPMLMELELLEPSLFFRFSESALLQFASAVARMVGDEAN